MRVVYFSEHEVKSAHQTLEPRVTFAWRSIMQYFRSLADTVEKSARHELFNFLGVLPEEVGKNGDVPETGGESPSPGSLLPEAHSEFHRSEERREGNERVRKCSSQGSQHHL